MTEQFFEREVNLAADLFSPDPELQPSDIQLNPDRLLDLARSGNSHAIAGLIAKKLHPYGITVKVKSQSACLELLLEASPVPDQRRSIMLILGELVRLQIPTLESVRLFARERGGSSVTWTQTLDLQPNFLVARSNSSNETSKLRDRAGLGDLSAMKTLIDRALVHKHVLATLAIEADYLKISLVEQITPDEQVCLTLICREMSHWHLTQLPVRHLSVMGYPRAESAAEPVWVREISLGDTEGVSQLQQLALGTRKFSQRSAPKRDRLTTPIDAAGWKTLIASLILASLLLASQKLTVLVSPLLIIVHELGHASVAWLFGYAAIPAFDFTYGGGVTMQTNDRIPLLLFGVGCGFAYLCYRYRQNDLTSRVLLGGAIVYGISIFTPLHSILIVAMGHGFELLFAGIFLYRALSGWSCRHSIERPLYGMLGLFTVFYDIRFAYNLLTNAEERTVYEMGKGGILDNDFVRLAIDYFHIDLSGIVLIFLLCSVATPIVTFLAFRYRVIMLYLFSRLFLVTKDQT
ncbi:MAG: hypothetical protein KME15_25700 [Drouetiella hepatica Uher 2000/2452]|jgi:hypothetical protein|uniref:Uncharacterized protein n=1 Tax=Drouetiella hepatica Uher 2000/2452 TaxID=904376 RepID=A0A951QGQ0_9CYAN|nr:hypothetical protein [Drouetiella hepatica Uher 2000/2452]